MNMAAKFVSAAEDELACPVCFQFYVSPHEPKNLPKCSHIFCQICLQKMKGELKAIKCPQCNKVSSLPKEGVTGLSTILLVRNLAERHPQGIKQRREYMQQEFHRKKEQTAKRLMEIKEYEKYKLKSVEDEEKQIDQSMDSVIAKAQELKSQLRNSSGLTQIKQKIAELETQITSIETLESNLETMTNDDFHVQTDALASQLGKFQIEEASQIYEDQCVCKFIPNVQLGRIVIARKLELHQEFAIGELGFATGLASKPNGLLAVCDSRSNPTQVILFRNKSSQYKKQSQFKIANVVKDAPLDVAISKEGKYLVTKCASGFDVHSKDGKYEKTISVMDPNSSQKSDVVTGSITVTKDGRILTGSRIQADGKDLVTRVVTVHDSAGNLQKTIPISISPLRVADIRGTHVAVSNGHRHKVCVYDLQSGKETLSLDIRMPAGICYDEQSDCMLIGRTRSNADGSRVDGSGIIEQYCSITGKFVACLAEGLRDPLLGLTFIQQGNMLVATDRTSIRLYKMK